MATVLCIVVLLLVTASWTLPEILKALADFLDRREQDRRRNRAGGA